MYSNGRNKECWCSSIPGINHREKHDGHTHVRQNKLVVVKSCTDWSAIKFLIWYATIFGNFLLSNQRKHVVIRLEKKKKQQQQQRKKNVGIACKFYYDDDVPSNPSVELTIREKESALLEYSKQPSTSSKLYKQIWYPIVVRQNVFLLKIGHHFLIFIYQKLKWMYESCPTWSTTNVDGYDGHEET